MKKALIIGIDYGRISHLTLPGCINDALNVSKMLIDAYNFREEDITLLRDDIKEEENYPTKRNILKKLRNSAEKLTSEDFFWFHISSHGYYNESRASNEKDGRDERLMVYNELNNNYMQSKNVISLYDDELNQVLQQFKCPVCLFIDTCNSGTMGDLPYNFKITDTRNFDNEITLQRTRENNIKFNNENIIMLSSALDHQDAADLYDDKFNQSMGAMTAACLKALRRFNHEISIIKLFTIISKDLKSQDFEQTPHLSSSGKFPKHIFSRSENKKQLNIVEKETHTVLSNH
jgi:hypothetical protein